MPDPTFAHLAEEAAAGLKADRELYLDVKEELTTHLEAKADALARQGHDEAESADLARKAFGSPLDVAAELVEANRGRMRLRALFRLAFGAVIVPVAVLLAVYMGYGRFARMDMRLLWLLTEGAEGNNVPALPGFGQRTHESADLPPVVRALRGRSGNAPGILDYWRAHRDKPDSHRYYAYYAVHLSADEAAYAAVMREGERLEPGNALYSVLLAEYYFACGVAAKTEKPKEVPKIDEVSDRRVFELGIAEIRRAATKPYLRTYQDEILAEKQAALPTPLLTEDYLQRVDIMADEVLPTLARFRSLSRKVPAAARLLIAEGRKDEAESVMDTWRSLAAFSTGQLQGILLAQLNAKAVAQTLSEQGTEVYMVLGRTSKARDARSTAARLKASHDAWRARTKAVADEQSVMLISHGSRIDHMMYPVCTSVPTVAELAPARMHEHVLLEEVALQAGMVALTLLLLGALLYGAFSLLRIRSAASVPVLLLPPARTIAGVLVLGVALPIALYWAYSRLPGIGGREFGWGHPMAIRFAMEIALVALGSYQGITWAMRRYLRRRCDDLGIPVPSLPQERAANACAFLGFCGVVGVLYAGHAFSFTETEVGCAAAVALAIGVNVITYRLRKGHGLYYGTLAWSLAPLYAFTILLLAFIVQPVWLAQEAYWLRQDTMVWGAVAQPGNESIWLTATERQAASEYRELVIQALSPTPEAR